MRPTRLEAPPLRAIRWTVQAKEPRRERKPVEESPDIAGRGGRDTDPGKPAGKCHRNTPPMARLHVGLAQARGKWCGKSAPAPWRHGGQANPTRCKAKQDRSKVARRGPGRPHRWMAAHDRIRLTGLLPKTPAPRGFSISAGRVGPPAVRPCDLRPCRTGAMSARPRPLRRHTARTRRGLAIQRLALLDDALRHPL